MTERHTCSKSPEWAAGFDYGYQYAMETIADELAAVISAAVSEWMKKRGGTQ